MSSANKALTTSNWLIAEAVFMFYVILLCPLAAGM